MIEIDNLRADLIRDEGVRLKPYTDTAGKLTIGVGHNLTDNGISQSICDGLLGSDIEGVLSELDIHASWWRTMPASAQRGLANMQFNLGWSRLSQFHNMLAALKVGEYKAAASAALDSAWATQVGERANRIAALFRSAG